MIQVGFLGVFITFSAFSLETSLLIEQGWLAKASLYILVSVLVCLATCFSGLLAGRSLGF